MARIVRRFPLDVTKMTAIDIPRQATPVLVGINPDDGGPALWVELDPTHQLITRRFVIYTDEKPIIGDGGYPYDLHVGSMIDRTFVWHVYEVRL